LYRSHEGKVSDKWQRYLEEYDRLFAHFRNKPIRILEIGVQNGGSLEIWAKYFARAEAIVGCDINPKCATLQFEDPRISVIVGDVTHADVQADIKAASTEFDIIIDDGSHTSREVIQSFCRLFAVLADGGIYVIEDLHCSYWDKHEGGLFFPFSSVSFLKSLADIVNREHWGLRKSADEFLKGFQDEYGFVIDTELLDSVNSLEFSDSICTIRKLPKRENLIGKRVIAGKEATVKPLKGTGISTDQSIVVPSQAGKFWSDREAPLAEEVLLIADELEEQKLHVKKWRQLVTRQEAQIQELSTEVRRRDAELNHLRQTFSWRMTNPIRLLWKAWNFDAQYYLEQNPDVAQAGIDPFTHYEIRGRMEGRLPKPPGSSTDTDQQTRASWIRRVAERVFVWRVREKAGAQQIEESGGEVGGDASSQTEFSPNDYAGWVRRYDTLSDTDCADINKAVARMTSKPLLSVLMPTYNTKIEWIKQAIDSVRLQLYENWELCIADDASTCSELKEYLSHLPGTDPRIKVVFRKKNGHISAASNSALDICTADWVALMDHDDVLPKHALYHVAEAINNNPDADLIYSDEDKISDDGDRREPYFKCDWNPDLFLSHNMISHLGVYKRKIILDVGGFREGFEGSQDHDLALRYIEKIDQRRIVHIPRVLYHWRMHSESTASDAAAKPYAVIAGESAIQEHFDRCGVSATVEGQKYGYRIYYDLPQPEPLVTIIVPTRNQLNLLKNCIESIREKTLYSNFELLVVDNNSDDPEALAYLGKITNGSGIRVEQDPQPFNFAEINNSAVRNANGEFIALVNNDIEVISPDWLGEMVSIACQPGVGAVGAKLLYPDDSIQHAGVVLGIGGVGNHAFKHLPSDNPGYFCRAKVVSSFSALTGACLVVRKDIYLEVDGLDGKNLTVAFNDLDFCLRLREAGYRNVWTPHAMLIHHESASRGYEDTPEKWDRFTKEIAYMKSRWGDLLQNDPAYSPNLTLQDTDFSFAWPPRRPD
jgi:glycosyltransferase involved in cell wall biosynthesis